MYLIITKDKILKLFNKNFYDVYQASEILLY